MEPGKKGAASKGTKKKNGTGRPGKKANRYDDETSPIPQGRHGTVQER